ncbi:MULTISPECIES: TonB family protein [Brucella]|uniref:TonB family protein n=1 Tax=Brucella TaxID=234 RepID=UPI0001B56DCE|nr:MULTISPECIES: energy transducer TonB [Brucella]EEX88036.1 TonB [Brucella ceti B1/94]EEZ09215.1 TonB [Brucella ceti M490/95/1]ENT07849.1 TonB family domain-containing protein [Brucella sp. F23/97]ENT15774.1 TonB family domain-containing protein [Brucella sp. F96/2]ENT21428.1 TonB family domain-containing protein [Brucella sp. UK1/97]
MNAPAPVHPPVKVARTDSYDHSFWRDAGRWLGAGVLVLLVHAAGAYVIHMAQEDNQPEGTEVAAMVVELVPDLVAPAEERVSEEVQPETTTEQPEEVQPEPEPEPQPEAKAEPQQVQEPEEVIPDVVEAQKPEVAVPLPVEKPQEKPEEKPKAEPKPEPKKVEKLKPQKPKPEKVKPKKAEKAAETREASAPRVDADNGAKVAASKRGETSASAGVIWAKWTSRLQSHMARNARFLQGKSRNTRGEAHVAFVIDPSGNVLSARIAVSSGDPAVDQLALEAARRASPVPAPPVAIAKARMPITMPLLFK